MTTLRVARTGLSALALSALIVGGLPSAHAQVDPSADFQKRLAAALTPEPTPQVVIAEVFTAGVVRVVDDRTLIVHRDDKDRDETIRLFGVEAVSAASPDGKTSARAYLMDQLKNAKVRIEGQSRDKQGILSAMVTPVPPPAPNRLNTPPDVSGVREDHPYGALNNTPRPPQPEKSLNATIIRMGLARYDARQSPNDKVLADAQNDAAKGHKGIWADTAPDTTGTVSSAEQP